MPPVLADRLTTTAGVVDLFDFTIVTPVAPSVPGGTSEVLLLDSAAVAKMRKNAEACARAGWVYQPFVVDVFGAVRADARRIIARLTTTRLTLAPQHEKFGDRMVYRTRKTEIYFSLPKSR